MSCNFCARKTLTLFIQTLTHTEPLSIPRSTPLRKLQTSQFSTLSRRSQQAANTNATTTSKPSRFDRGPRKDGLRFPPLDNPHGKRASPPEKEPERWQIEKAAIKSKLNGEAWNPRKKLSPDTMEGIRHLHQTYPQRFTTPVLAQHFKVSPEAIRRILKSKWRPSDEEEEERCRRWDKRGERIWSNLVEMGVKPPKRWREMGVGRAEPGQKPRWKSGARNTVPVNYRAEERVEVEDLIPIVDGRTGERVDGERQRMPFTERIL
jgi:hypothetical protein